jgi:hypothetical protein
MMADRDGENIEITEQALKALFMLERLHSEAAARRKRGEGGDLTAVFSDAMALLELTEKALVDPDGHITDHGRQVLKHARAAGWEAKR